MTNYYKGYRFPKEVIGWAARSYYRYKLSLRDISELLPARGAEVSHETIRSWCYYFGPIYAKAIRQKRGSSFKDKWHVDEMRVVINKEVFWLWRLIDSDGEKIEILLQKERNCQSGD